MCVTVIDRPICLVNGTIENIGCVHALLAKTVIKSDSTSLNRDYVVSVVGLLYVLVHQI